MRLCDCVFFPLLDVMLLILDVGSLRDWRRAAFGRQIGSQMTTKHQVDLGTYRKKPRLLAESMEAALEPGGALHPVLGAVADDDRLRLDTSGSVALTCTTAAAI